MPNQVVYEANFDYEATYEKLVQSGIAIVEKTEKGLLWVRFKGTSTIFLLSPNGKIQVKWADWNEKRILFKIFKNSLVSIKGEELKIKPLKQQVWINYPPPENFKLYWCEEKTTYQKEPLSELIQEIAVFSDLSDIERDSKRIAIIDYLIEKYEKYPEVKNYLQNIRNLLIKRRERLLEAFKLLSHT